MIGKMNTCLDKGKNDLATKNNVDSNTIIMHLSSDVSHVLYKNAETNNVQEFYTNRKSSCIKKYLFYLLLLCF